MHHPTHKEKSNTMNTSTTVVRRVCIAILSAALCAAVAFCIAVTPKAQESEDEVQPRAYIESVINTYWLSRDYYTSMRLNVTWRNLTFPNSYAETGSTYLQTNGPNLFYLYTSSGGYLGSFWTTMDQYQANYRTW